MRLRILLEILGEEAYNEVLMAHLEANQEGERNPELLKRIQQYFKPTQQMPQALNPDMVKIAEEYESSMPDKGLSITSLFEETPEKKVKKPRFAVSLLFVRGTLYQLCQYIIGSDSENEAFGEAYSVATKKFTDHLLQNRIVTKIQDED